MKIARLVLAAVALSLASACSADVTGPAPSRPHHEEGTTPTDSTKIPGWIGTTGSGA